MNRAQIEEAAEQAKIQPGEFEYYLPMWVRANEEELGLLLKFDVDDVYTAEQALLRTQHRVRAIAGMSLRADYSTGEIALIRADAPTPLRLVGNDA